MAENTNPVASKGVMFDYISSHRGGYPAVETMNQIYYIPPLTKVVWVTFPEPGRVYSKDKLTSYRITMDNEPITDREVVYSGQLHHDLLARAFINSGNKRIKNMGSYLRGWDDANDGGAAMYNKITVLGFPCTPWSS